MTEPKASVDCIIFGDVEPGVIDNEMLEKAIDEQGPKGEGGRLAREEGMPLEEIESLRLEFLNILRIDHLWMLTNLTKLSLSNNSIEKIENLDALENLVNLDLSFNKIEVIENLDQLEKIEVLTLYQNCISEINNLDKLKKLMIFSIGKNLIEDPENVIYLRKFQNLKSLNMADNPCSENEQFRLYVALFLPQITYYEYKLVRDEERDVLVDKYRKKIMDIEEVEKKEKAIQAKIEADIAEQEMYADSFVEFLGSRHLFDSMFEDDADGKLLLILGGETKNYFQEYEKNFLTATRELFEFGQVQYKIRKEEVDNFLNCVNTAKESSQKRSQGYMEDFIERKAEIFYAIKKMQEKMGDEQEMQEYMDKIMVYAEEYNDLLHKTWKLMMKSELTLYESMEETNQTFEHTLTEMVNYFVETAQGMFTQCRNLELNYMEQMTDAANKCFINANIQEDYYVPPELKPVMKDKEVMNNTLAASHDVHMQVIDAREDRLVTRARGWLDGLVSNLEKNEIKRNRAQVLEINHFLDIQREEFDEINTVSFGDLIDPDLSAALG